jgi:hypothetical protein
MRRVPIIPILPQMIVRLKVTNPLIIQKAKVMKKLMSNQKLTTSYDLTGNACRSIFFIIYLQVLIR